MLPKNADRLLAALAHARDFGSAAGPPARSLALAIALSACLAACLPTGRHGAIDASPFRPLSDAEIHRILGSYPSPGDSSSKDFHDDHGNVVAFPSERAVYADELIAYEVGDPEPIPEGQDARAALGPPDYSANILEMPHAVSLGNGGSITVGFSKGELVDGDGPDLYIFEIGPSVEGVSVQVSADGRRWVSVGDAIGGPCSIDIGPHVKPGDAFRYVRIRDIPHQGLDSEAWPGADIDAVAIARAARRVSLPSEVLFDFDSDVLSGGAPAELDRVIASIRAKAEARITVLGHTDDVGADEYNQALSERRAKAVAVYLAAHGVPKERIATRGLGESRPIAANDGDENRRRNRRVELVIQDE